MKPISGHRKTCTTTVIAGALLATLIMTTPSVRAQQQSEGVAPGHAIPAEGPPPPPPLPPAQPVVRVSPVTADSAPPARDDGDLPASAPHTISDWQAGEPIPRGYHPVKRARTGAIVAGAVTFGSLYMISLLLAAGSTDSANQLQQTNHESGLYVPVVGPFITMTQTSTTSGNMALLLDGLGQTAGAVLLIWGLTSPQTLLIRNDYTRPVILPQPMMVGKSGYGVGVVGVF
jgi:hypothetical protein